MKTPILGSSYVARSTNAADSRMVNLYPEINAEGGKEAAFLNRTPGLELIISAGEGPVRGMWAFGGYGYIVSGVKLFKVDTNWQFRQIGVVDGLGPVSMVDNGVQLFIACNPSGFIYDSQTDIFSPIADPDFPGAVTVGFLDGYFVFNEPNSQRIWVTALQNGLLVDPLDFASAEGSPDDLLSLIVDHREVWLFGTNTVEVWYNAGLPDFPLARIQGAFNEIGCAAAYSVAKADNGLFWLGADARGNGIVYRSKGYAGERISTHAIEWQIQQYAIISDAIGYTYQQDGHTFYVLTFPSANATWVYDVATQAWHERAAWEDDQFKRHRSNCQMTYNEKILVGDYENGNVYAFNLDVYTDNGAVQKWLRSWRALPTGANNLKRTAQHTLQLDCKSGVGLNGSAFFDPDDLLITEDDNNIITEAGDKIAIVVDYVRGANPRAMLRWSDDGGNTWSNEHWKTLGRIGAYGYRVFWRRLGMTMKIRDRVYEISGTDPVEIVINGAELILDPTNA
jgi:hypothetical protein